MKNELMPDYRSDEKIATQVDIYTGTLERIQKNLGDMKVRTKFIFDFVGGPTVVQSILHDVKLDIDAIKHSLDSHFERLQELAEKDREYAKKQRQKKRELMK